MGETSRLKLPYPELPDIADVPQDMKELATALDIMTPYGQGPQANRPVSTPGTPGLAGRLYLNTDTQPNPRLDIDLGTGWQTVGYIADGSIGTAQLADHSVTRIKLAMPAVGDTEIYDGAVVSAKLADGAVIAEKVSSTLRPSQGAGGSTEALRALGTQPGMAAPGIHASQHLPGGADPLDLNLFPAIPLGGVIDFPYASGSIPAWSALPVGQIVQRATYPDLHTLAATAGYPHGQGDGSTTFGLPDYRGRVGIGKDNMGGTAAGRITLAISGINGAILGAAGGSDGVALTTAQMPAHNHGGVTGGAIQGVVTWGGNWAIVTGLGGWGDGTVGHTHPISTEGGGAAHPNLQPSIIVNKILRVL